MITEEILLQDLDQRPESFLTEVLMGLSRPQKTIPPKYLYDEVGSKIFMKICELEEYYVTRAEHEILKIYGREMSRLIGPSALIIEPGSGVGSKVRHLLGRLTRPKGYVPIEIDRTLLISMTDELHRQYPRLNVHPVCADFTQKLELPLSVESHVSKKVVFFPGSTIGNFSPTEAIEFLKHYSKLVGSGGGFLLGVDLKKNPENLKRAYDDSKGVTASFNLNLLERMNREVAAGFDISLFEHEARYNADLGRVEMHLKSKINQLVKVNQTVFRFKEGETIHTENSYKYSIEEFCGLCSKVKLKLRKYWVDSKHLFCVYYFERE